MPGRNQSVKLVRRLAVSARRAAPRGAAALTALALAVSGCEGIQSALDPRGPFAQDLAQMWWIMHWAGWAIFLLVMALVLYTVFRDPAKRRPIHGPRLIVAGGIGLPLVVLTPLLVYAVSTGHRLVLPFEDDNLTVEVVGHMWWWEVRYPGVGPDGAVVSANEIRIPVGQRVQMLLTTADVIHSFWVPNLTAKIDMLPEKVTRIWMQAEAPGRYRGQCAEFCGAQHARMAFYVVAMEPDEFEAWMARESQPAREPDTEFLVRGQRTFLNAGCGACHTIRGTPATGRLGPDLTHVGNRVSLGAGMIENNVGTLAGWIADNQTIKPGNFMPNFEEFEGPTLRALAAYLDSLDLESSHVAPRPSE
jgi:cytochrome c oxidase subunit II